MITKFKLYETLNQGEPEEGDWVVCNAKGGRKHKKHIIENMIGRLEGIVKLDPDKHFLDDAERDYTYLIKYDNIPPEHKPFFIYRPNNKTYLEDVLWVRRKDISFWSKDKEDLEDVIQAKKYNL